MPEPSGAEPATARRERWIVAALLVLLVLFRAAVFVFWEYSQFDADQAVFGLMAKHIAELRAFPLFIYGQNYMLAVEAWLAAPIFLIAGVSTTALKLPLLAINIGVTLLLLRIFEREVGLRPALAAVPTLFFALPAPGTASHLVAAHGGNIGPFAFVLLIWLTRSRPNWCGVVFAIGFLQREFTLYGLLALLAIEAFQRTLFTRDGMRRRLKMLRTAAEVWLVVQWLRYFSPAMGPGTTFGDLPVQGDNVANLARRICFDVSALPSGVWRLISDHWPTLFGTRVHRLINFDIESTLSQGLPFASLLLFGAILVAAGGVAFRVFADRRWRREYDVCAYLVLVALLSAAGYMAGRCGHIALVVMRYDLLSLIGAAGLSAWFLRANHNRTLMRVWIVLACGTVAVSAIAHGRLLAEYVTRPPVGTKQLIVRHLEIAGTRYAVSDYWLAYSLTFLTKERVIVAADDFVRIREYQQLFEQHRSDAVHISRRSCVGGQLVARGVYFCRP